MDFDFRSKESLQTMIALNGQFRDGLFHGEISRTVRFRDLTTTVGTKRTNERSQTSVASTGHLPSRLFVFQFTVGEKMIKTGRTHQMSVHTLKKIRSNDEGTSTKDLSLLETSARWRDRDRCNTKESNRVVLLRDEVSLAIESCISSSGVRRCPPWSSSYFHASLTMD